MNAQPKGSYHEPEYGWSLRYPPGWHRQIDLEGFFEYHPNTVILSNLQRDLHHPKIQNGFDSGWDTSTVPSRFVALEFGHVLGIRPNRCKGQPISPTCPPETQLPLALSKAGLYRGGTYGVAMHILRVTHDRDSEWTCVAWFGPTATAADKQIARDIVASIRFDH